MDEVVDDRRPVIHVNSPAFYFNITKSAIFQDVIFDGINAFAGIEERTEFAAKGQAASTKRFRVPQWPLK